MLHTFSIRNSHDFNNLNERHNGNVSFNCFQHDNSTQSNVIIPVNYNDGQRNGTHNYNQQESCRYYDSGGGDDDYDDYDDNDDDYDDDYDVK